MPADLVDAADGLIADDVGEQVQRKHDLLQRYISISSAARKMYLGRGKAGATFIDLFSGAGRCRVRESNVWKDGSALVAWKQSLASGSPFSQIHIADIREEARNACVDRLLKNNAPVKAVVGNAVQAADQLIEALNPAGLHLVFLDPYNLRALDFRIFETLAKLKRVDLIVHVSAMDLQRNLDKNIFATDSDFDYFCPGWRDVIDANSGQFDTRSQIIEFWKSRVAELGVGASTQMKLITGTGGQRLYWLLIAAKHELAKKLWKVAANTDGQTELF